MNHEIHIEDAIVSCFTFRGYVKINVLFIHPEVLFFANENWEKNITKDILFKIFIFGNVYRLACKNILIYHFIILWFIERQSFDERQIFDVFGNSISSLFSSSIRFLRYKNISCPILYQFYSMRKRKRGMLVKYWRVLKERGKWWMPFKERNNL